MKYSKKMNFYPIEGLVPMFSTENVPARMVEDIVILGSDLLSTDDRGRPSSPIASVIPANRIVVTAGGIHAVQVGLAVSFLRRMLLLAGQRELGSDEEEDVYKNAVSLLIRDGIVLIRADPGETEKIFAADEILQHLLPKQRIQFTGTQLGQIRRDLQMRGEIWRISPPPHSVEEMVRHIRSSGSHVGSGTVYYQSAATGGRFLTLEQFSLVRPLLRSNRQEALRRLKEMSQLTGMVNNQGVPELSFFVEQERNLPAGALGELANLLERSTMPEAIDQVERAFDHFQAIFADAAGPELASDDESSAPWRAAMFCRLFAIDEKTMEEWSLGLSPEFHLNVRWLPGARIAGRELSFDPFTQPRVRSLIKHYLNSWPGLISINLGRVESSQTKRDRTGEEREVYLAALGLKQESERIRLVRMMKWEVRHRLKKGIPLEQSIAETISYRRYIFDRLKAFRELGIAVPYYTEIRLDEEIEGIGKIPVFFFERPYFSGFVTEKIPPGRYARAGFIERLARLLGKAAAVSLVMGRACPRTNDIFFDDGDEVVQLDEEGLPNHLIIAETTGSFNDYTTPLAQKLPRCLHHLSCHLDKAASQGIGKRQLSAARAEFLAGLVEEIERMQHTLQNRLPALRALFADRIEEPGDIRFRWNKILDRLEAADPGQLKEVVD